MFTLNILKKEPLEPNEDEDEGRQGSDYKCHSCKSNFAPTFWMYISVCVSG